MLQYWVLSRSQNEQYLDIERMFKKNYQAVEDLMFLIKRSIFNLKNLTTSIMAKI